MNKEKKYLDILNTMSEELSKLKQSVDETKLKKKNVSLEEGWIHAYSVLPQPKLSLSMFCSLAIKEKLEREGIICKL